MYRKRPFATQRPGRRQTRTSVCRIPCRILCLADVEPNLTLASPRVNRNQKGAKDAAEWQPDMNQRWFAHSVVAVRRAHRLTIERREADAIDRILVGCPSTEKAITDELRELLINETGRRARSVLSVAFNYENEWPLRIGNLIPDVDEWYTTHPSLLEFSAVDILSLLPSVEGTEIEKHPICFSSIQTDAAGRAVYPVDSFIDLDDLRCTAAGATFERHALTD